VVYLAIDSDKFRSAIRMPRSVSVGRSGLNADGSLLQLSQITKRFGGFEALNQVELTLMPGDVCVLIGPSGSGKSTLLRCADLLYQPDIGEVWFGGALATAPSTDENHLRAQIGVVFQSFNLFPHRTVLANITLALRCVLGLSKGEAIDRAMGELERVGLVDRANHYPGQLSGGQQQRAAIARAVAMRPRLMLFDEVTSALDPELVKGVLSVLRTLAEAGTTMMIATHEMKFAREVATQLVFLEQGRMIEAGPPDSLFENPQSERLKRFLSDML
jgi:polar amino acid transport system ATP-binding protein